MIGAARRSPGKNFEGFRDLEYAEVVQIESFWPTNGLVWRHLGKHRRYFTAAYHDESIRVPRNSCSPDSLESGVTAHAHHHGTRLVCFFYKYLYKFGLQKLPTRRPLQKGAQKNSSSSSRNNSRNQTVPLPTSSWLIRARSWTSSSSSSTSHRPYTATSRSSLAPRQ